MKRLKDYELEEKQAVRLSRCYYGDYTDMVDVGKVNFDAACKELKNYKGVYVAWQGIGFGEALYYVKSELTKKGLEAVNDMINRLDDYPCLNNEALSELENKLAKAAIAEYVKDHNKRAILSRDKITPSVKKAMLRAMWDLYIEPEYDHNSAWISDSDLRNMSELSREMVDINKKEKNDKDASDPSL